MKTCRRCKREFPATLDYFYRDTKVKSGLRSRCIECINKGNLETRDAEKARLSISKWRKENPEKYKAQQKRASAARSKSGYYIKYYHKNKDKINARRNRWLKETGKGTQYVHKRRAAMKEEVASSDWERVLDFYGRNCLVPNCPNQDVTQDHVIPLSKEGRNHVSNLQPLCLKHNCQKQAKTIDYRPDRGEYFARSD